MVTVNVVLTPTAKVFKLMLVELTPAYNALIPLVPEDPVLPEDPEVPVEPDEPEVPVEPDEPDVPFIAFCSNDKT